MCFDITLGLNQLCTIPYWLPLFCIFENKSLIFWILPNGQNIGIKPEDISVGGRGLLVMRSSRGI